MRPGGRLQAAIEILAAFEQQDRPVAALLRDWGRSNRFAGSADRVAIGNHVHDALRRRRSAAALLGEETPRAVVLGAFLLESGQDAEAIDAMFAGDRFAPPPLTPGERASISGFDVTLLAPAAAADIPDWCESGFAEAFGPAWIEEGRALAARPPLDLRVNRLKAERENVLETLRQHHPAPTPISPDGIRIAPVSGSGRHPNLEADPAFLDGRIEIQDEGSQLVAILAVQDGTGQILDFCAGGGGKTLAMSALLGNRGQIHAWDADRRRLMPIQARLQRAGCRNVQVMTRAGDLEHLFGRMDLVLVDAPCTGSGTWRRRPDTKWRLKASHIDERAAQQDSVLAEAARYVRPGGLLAYVTCSIFPAENDARVAAFLDVSDSFHAVDISPIWQQTFPDRQANIYRRKNGLSLTPARTGTDGFFISMLKRSG